MNNDQAISPIAIKAVIVNNKKQILVLKRSDLQWLPRKRGWDICGGMYEMGTDPEKEIISQIKQETGLNISQVKIIKVVNVGLNNAQNLRYLLWIGYEAKTDVSEIALSTEHTEYKWMSKKEALELDWPEPHRKILEAV